LTAIPVLIALAVATLLLFVVINLRSSRDVLSAGVLLRFYLYIASFVTLVVLVAGLIYLLTGLFSLGSRDFSYAHFPRPIPPPTNTAGGVPAADNASRLEQQELERQRDDQSTDLLRGGTLTVIGGLLFALHLVLRRHGAEDGVEGNFRRGFLMVSLVTFGLIGLVALPVGVYQTLKFFLIPPLPTQTRVAPGNTLATGIVLTPLWIAYLLALTRQARGRTPDQPPIA
jgi:hypothetical protein